LPLREVVFLDQIEHRDDVVGIICFEELVILLLEA
jgi:hypothetical protein